MEGKLVQILVHGGYLFVHAQWFDLFIKTIYINVGKRTHDTQGETQQSESPPQKRIRLEEGELMLRIFKYTA